MGAGPSDLSIRSARQGFGIDYCLTYARLNQYETVHNNGKGAVWSAVDEYNAAIGIIGHLAIRRAITMS